MHGASLQACPAASWFSLTLGSGPPPSAALVLHGSHSMLAKMGEAIHLRFGSRERESPGQRWGGGWGSGGQAPQPFQELCVLSWLFWSPAPPSFWCRVCGPPGWVCGAPSPS